MNLVTVVGGIFSLAGAGLLILAGQHFSRRRTFIRSSSVVPGIVVAVREERDGMEAQSFRYPRVRFRTAAGRDVTVESSMAFGATWRIGEAVSVRYRLDHPEMADFDNFAALWGPTLLFALLALAFVGVGAGLMFGFIPV
jgi:hypothetical protein